MKSLLSDSLRKPTPNEAELRDAYIGERLSLKGVGERFGISVSRVQTLLDRAGIPRRSLQDVHSTSKTRTITKEQLEALYFGQQLGIRKIAEQLGTSKRLIESLFDSFEIKRRSSAEANRLNAGLSTDVQLTEDFLRAKYEVEKLSLEEIRRQFGFTTKTLRRAFEKFGIKRRLHEDACLLVQKGRSLYAATPEQLKELYVQEKFSCLAISKIFNSSERTTRIRLVRAGIAIRSVAEAAEAREVQRGNPRASGLVSIDQVREQYEVSCQSMDSIAKALNLSRGAVGRCLDAMGVKRRSVADYALIEKPQLMDLSKELLKEEYLENGRSVNSIAAQFGASYGFVVGRLEKFGIPVRSLEEQREIDRRRRKGSFALRVADTLDWGEIRNLYERDRLGTVKIAERFGVSDQTISRGLKRIGVEVRREHTVSTPELEGLTREFLRQEYLLNQRGLNSIAKEIGVASHVLKRRLEEFEMPVRSAEEQRKIDSAKERGVYHRPVSSGLDWSLIRSLYEDSHLSILSISKSFKVESGTISRGLQRIGVTLRPSPVHNHTQLAVLTKEFLVKEYLEKKLSVNAIATSLGVSNSAVAKRLEGYGIPLRSRKEQSKIDRNSDGGSVYLGAAFSIYHSDSQSGKVTGEERIADDSVVDPAASLEEKEHGELLASSLEELAKNSPICSYVLERFWGIGRNPQSIEGIAVELKVDPGRIQLFLNQGMDFVRSRVGS